MNKRIKKFAAGIVMLMMFAVAAPFGLMTSLAATGKLSFSDPSATVGNQVSVTMKIELNDGPGLGSSNVMLNYDSSALEFIEGTGASGGAGSVRVQGSMESSNQKTFTFTLKFKTLKAGSSQITVASQEVYDADDQTVELSHVGSSTVKAEASAGASSDAGLSGLTISPGALSPEFSADVTSYTTTVSGTVDKLTVSALAADAGATVSISGNESLTVGENTVECRVTAEDGSTVKTYTILVTKIEGDAGEPGGEIAAGTEPSGSISADTSNWQVAETFDASLLPEGFTQSEFQYDGKTVQSGYNDKGNVIVYMTDENGNGDFFYYDETSASFVPYVTVVTAEKSVIVLPSSTIPADVTVPEGFAACTIDIGTHTVEGWIWGSFGDGTPEYCVVYGMNENGEKNFYRYDQQEMTMQRYFPDPEAESLRAQYVSQVEEFNSLVDDYDMRGIIIAVLFGLCIVLVIIVIVLLLTRKPKARAGNERGGLTEDFYDDEPVRPAKKTAPKVRKAAPRYEDELEEPSQVPVKKPVKTVPRTVTDVEKDLAASLAVEVEAAKEAPKKKRPVKPVPAPAPAPVADEEEDDDDFEFIDLDL